MKNQKLIVTIVYSMCAIPIVAGAFMGYLSWKAISDSLSTPGVVSGFIGSSDSSSTEAPIVEYQVDGKPYRITGSAFTAFSAYSAGQTVPVLYKAGHPEGGTINSFTELWFGPAVFAGFGLIGMAIFWLVQSRQKKFQDRMKESAQNPELMRLVREMNEKSKGD